jgi:hypothetical protein
LTASGQEHDPSEQEQDSPKPKRDRWKIIHNALRQCACHGIVWTRRQLQCGFAGLTYISPLLTALATAGIVWVAYWQWDALDKTDQTLRAGQRAWIGLDGVVKIDVLETIPHLGVEAHYRIQNFGNGPAIKVIPIGWFWTDEKLMENLALSICQMASNFTAGSVPHGPNVRNPGPMGYTLFPNQGHEETIGSPSDPWTGPAEPDLTHFRLIGCIAYINQFKVVHWTRFCMEPQINASLPLTKDTPLTFCSLYNDTDESDAHKNK